MNLLVPTEDELDAEFLRRVAETLEVPEGAVLGMPAFKLCRAYLRHMRGAIAKLAYGPWSGPAKQRFKVKGKRT